MHPRQRSPRGFYASEYRNRGGGVAGGGGGGDGFGRGYNNRRGSVSAVNVSAVNISAATVSGGGGGGGDVFVEAGRLAAEYLVFQGLLPPSVLSLKVYNQNGSFKKHVGVSGIGVGGIGVGVGVGENLVDGGRSSALARLGNNAVVAGVDGGFTGRGKLGIEEFGQKGRRRGSFKSNGFDLGNREYRRNGSWSGRFVGGSDIRDDDNDDDVVDGIGIGIGSGSGSGSGVRQQDEEEPRIQQVEAEVVVGGGVDGGSGGDVDTLMEKSNLSEFVPTSEDGNDLEGEANKNQVSVSDGELLELKQDSSGEGKDAGDMDVEFVGSSNDLENMSIDKVKEVVKDGAGSSGEDGDKPSISKNSSAQSSDQENDSSGEVFTDLLSLCKSVKVPTKTRSSLTNKNLKAFPVANNAEENVDEIMDVQEPVVLAENESIIDSSSGNLLSDKTYDIVHIDSDAGEEPVHSVEDMKELDTACEAEEDQSVGSQSDKDQEFTAELPEFEGCGSMSEERGEKRVVEEDVDVREDTKRLREWQPLPSPIPKTEGYFLHNTPIEVKDSPEEHVISVSHVDKMSLTSDQGNLMSGSQFPDEGDRPFFQCSEAKPPLPNSFRTCDLNLMETSEVHDNHIDHPVLIYSPTVSDTKENVPVDNDLSMSHASVSGKFNTHGANGKEIEVIDLENDSIQEEKAIDSIDRKTDTLFTGLDGFSSHAQNAADINDVQDGYGLMISELLGTDFANCSSVADDINAVHNEIGLDNGTGTLAEDDSIYMSLGELSFLRPWEQPPPQDYQKF
ncbi:uncharacterized protein At4g26450 [Vicia villosa]|uniref:uncharacterized protein At4g26450 n=1 Tax=Vicia villosa TaxID=3911 RepID=UPI00273C486E|nr:uncharacterized protein At4g26450 [Vicia villosa]